MILKASFSQTSPGANVEIVIIIKEPTITNKSLTGRGDINKCFVVQKKTS